MADMCVGAGGRERRMFCVRMAACGVSSAAMVVATIGIAMIVVAHGTVVLVDRIVAVAVDRRQPQSGRRHGRG